MNWTEEEVCQLIELVRRRPCLYDDRHESYNDQDLKQEVTLELAEILSSTRPGVSVEEVMNKWEEIKAEFFKAHLKIKKIKKRGSYILSYYNKMKFMLSHIPLENQAENSGKAQEQKILKKVAGNDSKHLKIAVPKYSPETGKKQELVNGDSGENDGNGLSTTSVTALALHSDSSPENNDRCESPVLRPKRFRPGNTYSRNSPVREISFISMTSPHMVVNDSILDRTEPNVNESNSFGHNENSSNFNESSLKDDEDTLYAKYLSCKLKKLDACSKLRFKVEIEKLFYQTLEG